LHSFTQAASDIRLACDIATREPQADPNLVDLSAFYNAGFKGNWHGNRDDNDLSEIPTGIQKLGSTAFDVRGLIQLASSKYETNRFPDQVTGLPIAKKCSRIHFLHAAIWGFDPPGTVIGKYVIHYADGAMDEKPLVLGKDALDWWTKPPELDSSPEPQVAWTGHNGNSRQEGKTIQLYKTTWEIPRPDAKILSLDFVSAKKTSALFLVAVTIEGTGKLVRAGSPRQLSSPVQSER
jgi:hypothetical protein